MTIQPVGGAPARWRDVFLPKTIVCLREGYTRHKFIQDFFAGVTVSMIALPLAMAFAISSGPGTTAANTITPQQGLYTAIVAGFVIALLGGSRVSVAGPTGAFVPILFAIVAKDGYSGLAIATVMAGTILILMGLARLGSLIKFIPYPVTTGFTSGIAVIIFSQQIKDLLGLQIDHVPADFLPKWAAYFQHLASANWATVGVSAGSLIVMIILRKRWPRLPAAIIAVILAATVVSLAGLDAHYHVETIQSRFGGIPRTPPLPRLPSLSWAKVTQTASKARELIPEATTIALLAAIESLLCCVVSDGMIGGRHKSNCELVAQGIGNILSIFFGGIPATGAIARTAANCKAGGRTPFASMIHAVFVLIVMLALAPLAGKIPLAVLAAILVIVSWNMSEIDHFRSLLKAPRSDILVLLTTFGLTVLADLTVAVGVGMVLASILFMKRMSEVTNVGAIQREFDEGGSAEAEDVNSLAMRQVPLGVEVYEINGPFFFGVADRLNDTLRHLELPPKVFILRMRRVPAVDATGMHALDEFYQKCKRQGTQLLLAGIHAQPMFALTQYGLLDKIGEENLFENIDDALARARTLLHLPAVSSPQHIPEVARESTRPATDA